MSDHCPLMSLFQVKLLLKLCGGLDRTLDLNHTGPAFFLPPKILGLLSKPFV